MRRETSVCLLLLLLLVVGRPAAATEEKVSRFYVRFEAAELRVASDLRVTMVAFTVPGGGSGGVDFEAPLVDTRRLEACRVQPHRYQVRIDGSSGEFWRLDTKAGQAWRITGGVFGLVGGKAELQPWVVVRPAPGGEGAVAVLRDLELTGVVAKKALALKGAGLTLATEKHLVFEASTAWAFRVRPSFGWRGGHLEVDIGAQEVRFASAPLAAGEAAASPIPLSLPLHFWLDGGRYGDAHPDVPRLLTPAADALVDNGRFDTFDLQEHEFRWSEVPGADAYQIYVKNRRAQNPVIDERTTRPCYREEDRAYVTKANEDAWEWKVRAIRGKTKLPWSEVRPFRFEPANTDPADDSIPWTLRGPENTSRAPRLLSPKPDAVLDNGREDGREPLVWEFRWGRLAKADAYEIAVLHDSEYPVVRVRVKRSKYEFESGTLRAFGLGRTGWTWRVRGLRRGEALPWSEASPFVLEPLDSDPPADAAAPSSADRRRTPKLTSPKPGAVLKNGPRNRKGKVVWTFRWASVPDAQGYELELRRRGATHGPRTIRTETTSHRAELGYQLKRAECYGHTWRVRALLDGEAGPWSAPRTFDVEPPHR